MLSTTVTPEHSRPSIIKKENDILTPFFDPLFDSMRWHAQVDFIF